MICVESEFHGGLVPTSPDEALTLWPLPPPQAPPSQQLPGETCSQRAQSTAHTASTEQVTYMSMHKKHTEALYTLLPHTQPHNHTGEPGARGAGICVVLGEHRGRVEASIKFQTQMQYELNFTSLLLRFQLEGSYNTCCGGALDSLAALVARESPWLSGGWLSCFGRYLQHSAYLLFIVNSSWSSSLTKSRSLQYCW